MHELTVILLIGISHELTSAKYLHTVTTDTAYGEVRGRRRQETYDIGPGMYMMQE